MIEHKPIPRTAEYSPNKNRYRQPDQQRKPLVSLVAPAYNEATIIEGNLTFLCDYMETLEAEYDWELIIVNDGSRDATGELAEGFAKTRSNIHVVHHITNFGLGQALRSGFDASEGDYIITLDLDLSYAPKHIERLLAKIRETGAEIVMTSPYMEGGAVSNVPWFRKTLSIWANRFLSLTTKRNLKTLTGMVRAYDANFLKTLNLKSMGMEINPEIVHKAILLDARIEEIPAHLNWRTTKTKTKRVKQPKRKSSMKILRHIWSVFFYGFLFRPVMFFIIPCLMFFLIACFSGAWVLIHCWTNFQQLTQYNDWGIRASYAVAAAFQQAPHTFVIAGMALMLAIQLFSLGILSVQSKRYFEEVFYLGTAIYKSTRRNERKEL
jgi:glycosyltransferase involved in cell wall biosynthesis